MSTKSEYSLPIVALVLVVIVAAVVVVVVVVLVTVVVIVVVVVVVVVAVDEEKAKQKITYGHSTDRILSITVRSYFCDRFKVFETPRPGTEIS